MTQNEWNQHRPQAVAGYRLCEPAYSYPDCAIFCARREAEPGSGAFSFPGRGPEPDDAFVWVMERQDGETQDCVNRFLEAAFFDHPNLLRVYAAGEAPDSGGALLYAVTDIFDYPLTDAPLPRPLTLLNLRPVLLPVCAGLAWLHSEGLVYCGLRTQAVVFARGNWKLADFSELRIAGKAASEETRRLMIRRDLSAPPEAWEGVVSPAWDAWSLGALIQTLFTQEARAMGGNPRVITAGPAELVPELAETDPALRIGVAQFAERLNAQRAAEENAQAAGVPSPRWARAAAMRDLKETRRSSLWPTESRASALRTGPMMPQPAPLSSRESAPPRLAYVPAPAPPAVADSFDPKGNNSPRKQPMMTMGAIVMMVAAIAILVVSYGQPHETEAPVVRGPSARSAPRTMASAANRPNPLESAGAGYNVNPSDERRRIFSLLDRWAEAMRARDPERQASYYAPVVEQFFGRRNVSASDVRRDRAKSLAGVGTREFSIDDVRIEQLDPDRAVVSFVKTWNSPADHFTASTREEMVMRQMGGSWKIASERELNSAAPPGQYSREAASGSSRRMGDRSSASDSIAIGNH